MEIRDNVLVKVRDEDIINGTLTIPESVTSIGNNAFSRCESLTKINIPESVTSIGNRVFYECNGLTEIKIPKSVTSIGNNAFERCIGLTEIKIPEGVTSIGDGAFYGCSELTEINIPESITSIANRVFWGCIGLRGIKIPKSVIKIGFSAFNGCSRLTEIKIPESVTSIGNNAFERCIGLTEIKIPESVTSIGDSAFYGCSELTEINIPESVTSIGDNAFYGCRGLTKIKIPESVTSIGNSTFNGCIGLMEIKIPKSVTNIGVSAFNGCSELTEINIPESVTSIGISAFRGCRGLTEIKIPESVTSIGYSAFYGCSELTEINIPESVTSIGNNAFEECMLLTEMKIPESVTSIGSSAFSGCRRLTEINIPESVTSIGYDAFRGCRGLTEIKIPEGVMSIGNSAFYGCIGLTEIEIPESVMSIGDDAFHGCIGLTEINIPESVTSMGERAFFACDELEHIKLSKNIIKQGNLLFKLYKDYGELIDEKLMFGDDLSRFKGIKSQARFSVSEDYDEDFMNQLYHKIIFSVGIDELEVMVKIPQLGTNQLAKYEEAFKAKEEAVKQLYQEKQKIIGDFGIVVKILKQLAISVNTDKSGKSSNELDILKQINQLLSNPELEIASVEELIKTAMTNANYDSSKINGAIQNLQSSINKSQFQRNMKEVRADILNAISSDDTTFGAQLASLQVETIEKIIEDKLRKIYMSNNKVSTENLREDLLNELSNNTHAIYIRQNAQNITDRFMNLIETNEDFRRKINYNAIDAIKSVKKQVEEFENKQVRYGWITAIKQAFKVACNGQNIESIPDEYTDEQIEILGGKLGIPIETEQVAVLKKGADREEAYKLLESIQAELPEEEQLIVTYKQLHDMFGGVQYPYSEEFKKYFKIHREEFLKNPKYIAQFATICNNFDSIINSPELKNIYLNGKLELNDVLGYIGSRTFANQREGDEELVRLATSIGQIVTEKQFAEVQNVFDIVKMRERASVPPMYVNDKKSKFRGRMLSPNDIIAMFAGNITDCCQKFGDVGMGAMLLGAIEENAGIFVVEELQDDGSYQIIGQSLTIRQKGKSGNNERLTFDNIEITKNVKSRLTKDEEKEILKIYQKAGKQALEMDKKFLGQLLKDGKITQDEFDNLVLKEVIAGRGYNDLSLLDTLQTAKTIVPDEAYYQYRSKEWGTYNPWIDSTEERSSAGVKFI